MSVAYIFSFLALTFSLGVFVFYLSLKDQITGLERKLNSLKIELEEQDELHSLFCKRLSCLEHFQNRFASFFSKTKDESDEA